MVKEMAMASGALVDNADNAPTILVKRTGIWVKQL